MSTTISLGNRPGRAATRERLGVLLVIAVIALASIGTERLVREPDVVGRITMQNPTDFLVDARVTNGRGDGWVGLGVLEPHHTVVTREVLDQGDAWRFEIRAGGVRGAILRRTRAELERSHWRIVVPSSAAQRLEQARVPPAPR
jgi:hypothetical protein